MKHFALLRLENNVNKVIFDTHAIDVRTAAGNFNRSLKGIQLDQDGYYKSSSPQVTFCVAEYFEPIHHV